MDPLTKQMSLIRYCVVLAVMCAVTVAIRGIKPTSFIGFILFAVVSLKYPFFDYLVRMVRHRWPMLKVLPWLWIGFAFAAVVDIGATWVTMNDKSGASFALWVSVLITPFILAGAIVFMAVHTMIARKR